MRAKITAAGLNIPRELLRGAREAEIRPTEGGRLIVSPLFGEEEPAGHRAREEAELPGGDRESDELAARQRRLARQYPAEYVVLLGERVTHHSTDREAAYRAYDEAFGESSTLRPVICEPRRDEPELQPHRPRIRGRSLQRSWAR